MANTVNDVMNVIASPDYGIKNIAGTTQEILAILSGTHNSKGNIHSIVDDVKNLLQKLVSSSTQKTSVEVGGSSKINQKHIESILDETKSIRKAIDNLAAEISKKGGGSVSAGVVKLSDKASEKVANAMAKNIEKQNSGSGMAALADAFSKLKDISVKDIIFGRKKLKIIGEIFKDVKEDLNIDKDELKSINGVIDATPAIINTLSKVGRKVDRITKKETVQKLSGILVGGTSILSIALLLQDNEKTFENANKVAKNIKELASALNGAMRKLLFAALWAKLAYKGISVISSVIDETLPLAKKLAKNKKDIENGTKVAKQMSVLAGNLLITSIFLTFAIVPALLGTLGAMALSLMVDKLIPVAKTLSKNNKQMGKAVGSAIIMVAFTGIMLITSFFLAKTAEMGIPALLGALVMLGVTKINILTFKILGKAQKNILKGAISMLVLSISLIFYGIALGLITKATKDVKLKQVIMITLLTGILVGAVIPLGIPQVFALVMLGSIAMMVIGLAYISFGTALSLITKATKSLKMKHILLVTGSMVTLALGVAGMAIFLVPVLLGSITLGAMSLALLPFVGALSIINKMETVPIKKLNQVLSAMRTVGNFFKNNKISLKAVWNAAKYMLIMPPFSGAVYCLGKLKKIGTIPMKLVYGALNAIRAVGNFFKNNKLSFKAIWNAAKYRLVMSPFSGAVRLLGKLKKIGTIPMKLVHGALNAIRTVGNFFKNNKLSFKAIWNAAKYRLVMGPFRGTVRVLGKLKEIGTIPMKLVYGALNAMSAIANYYSNNPISKAAIKASYRYASILRPFGSAVGYLAKLKEMGTIPMKLVHGALNAIRSIKNFYQGQKLGFFEGIKARISANMITGVVSSFGKAVEALGKLKELRSIPTDSIDSVLISISNISWFYRNVKYSGDIEEKSEFSEYIVDKFTEMAQKIQDKFKNLKQIDHKAVMSITFACRNIIYYYRYTKFGITRRRIKNMNEAVIRFVNTAGYLKEKTQGFTIKDYMSVVLMVRAMERIMQFLRSYSLNPIQSLRARRNLSLLSRMSSVVATLSGVNTSNISSIGGALSDALSGVNTVNMDQIQAVTEMFNAFNGINKSESLINKFTESVKEFTETCKELMDSMNNNTDAINNADTGKKKSGSFFDNIRERVSNFIEGDSNENNTNIQTNSIRIANVDEIAKTIAEQINGALSVDVGDTQVQLLINGTGGNEWTITRC